MATANGRVERLEAEARRRRIAAVARWAGVDAVKLQAELDRCDETSPLEALAADLGVPVEDVLPMLEEAQAAFDTGRPIESVPFFARRIGGAPCRA